MNRETPKLDTTLVQRKGMAEKPADMAVASTTVAPAKAAIPSDEAKTRSLTLRLSEAQYDRLRKFAFDRRLTHQAVIEAALMAYLDRNQG